MCKFRNTYRIPSARLQSWDYGWNGSYFVTICTNRRQCCFGDILYGEMKYSAIGEIAHNCWLETFNHFPFVTLDVFVVMPNHLHGIVILTENDNDPVETTHALSLQKTITQSNQSIGEKRFQNQGKNTISSIIGSYKSAVSKHTHRFGFDFAWQPRFYDHIIRNDKSYQAIAEYIIHNPLKWENDTFNPSLQNY